MKVEFSQEELRCVIAALKEYLQKRTRGWDSTQSEKELQFADKLFNRLSDKSLRSDDYQEDLRK